MWKSMWIKCLKLLFLIRHMNATLFASNGLLNQDFRRDLKALEEEVTGRDFTEQEMAKYKIWPGGVIPYYIDSFSYDLEFRTTLEQFLESCSQNTGVRFTKLSAPPKEDSYRWVFFVYRRETPVPRSYTTKDFTNEGVQIVNLDFDSPYNGELYATILAILGIPPQHNAPNRDEYITVNFDNIIPDYKNLYEKLNDDEWLFKDLPYDLFSAGHYDLHKYSVNGKATIETKASYGIDGIGQGKGLSWTDLQKIFIMYNYISKPQTKLLKSSNCEKLFEIGPKRTKRSRKNYKKSQRRKNHKNKINQ